MVSTSLRRFIAIALICLLAAGSVFVARASSTLASVERASARSGADAMISHLTWDLPTGEPTTLDYVKSGDYSPDTMVSNMCDYLLRLNPDFSYSPELATSWKRVNLTTLVFTIRRGVKFWDGHLLTAADVVYSMLRNMNPKDGPVNGSFYSNVKSIEQTGPYQVTVRFSQPDELFLKEMATIAGGVAEKAYMVKKGASFGTAKGGIMCSGPFELVAWHPGSDIVLKRNPNYWDKALEPHVQTVDVKFIVNTSTLTSALVSGEIDGTYQVPYISIPAVRRATNGTTRFGKSLEVVELAIATTKGPMANPRVRRALSMVIDRAAIVRSVYHGAGVPNKTLTPPTAWDPAALSVYQRAYNALPSLTPNVAAAQKLVAGQPGIHKPLVLATLAGDQSELDECTIIQQEARQIGLNIRIRQMQALDFSNLFYLAQYRKGIDLVFSNGYLDVPDPMDYLVLFFGPSQIFNWTNFNNPAVNRDVLLARKTYNPQKRARLITAAQRIYMSSQFLIPLVNPREVSFLNNHMAGAPTTFAYIYEPSFAYIRPK